jgi:hypothetical protein
LPVSTCDFQFVNAYFDCLSGVHFGVFAGLNFAAINFDGVAANAFQLERAFLFR